MWHISKTEKRLRIKKGKHKKSAESSRCSLLSHVLSPKKVNNSEKLFHRSKPNKKWRKREERRQICFTFLARRENDPNEHRWFITADIKRNRNNNVKIIKWNLFYCFPSSSSSSYLNEHTFFFFANNVVVVDAVVGRNNNEVIFQ